MTPTIFNLLRGRTGRRWKEATIQDAVTRVRFADLASHVNERAAGLREAGVRAGDRILIACPNSVDWVISTLAVMRLRAIAAPIDPGATAREIASYERIVEPAGVILGPDADPSRFQVPILTSQQPPKGSTDRTIGQVPGAQDRALIVFTSGTTGVPKAVVLQHSTLVYAGQGIAQWLGLTETDRVMLCMPLFHANAIYYSLMGSLCAGASVVIAPRFSVSQFWADVRRTGATEVNLMGPMVSMLLRQPQKPDDLDNPLRLVYTAACQPEVARAFMKRFGVEIVEGYGLTETPYGCINSRARPKWGSVGLARQHPANEFVNEVRILPASGDLMNGREVGEIAIRNAATFLEYWANPIATRDAFSDGWLRTGDLGYQDEGGYFFIIGRAKELIRRNGVNISPAEVESVVRDISDVEDAALVGLPSPLGEEIAVLAVIPAQGAPVDGIEDRVLSKLRKLLSREKIPDRVVVVDDIPRTRTQRIERGKLRQCLSQNGTVDWATERQ